MNLNKLGLALGFAVLLLVSAALRYGGVHETALAPYASFATPIYVGATLAFAFLLPRAGVSHRRVGFGLGFKLSHLGFGVLAFIAVSLAGEYLGPLFADLFGASRDVSRFSDVPGSLEAMAGLLALSWTFAAFGEEIAFRILLMRAVAAGLGDGPVANVLALIVQAAIFGLVHAYQGPAGIAGTFISGLIYGSVVLVCRGAIWPAAIAHGLVNTVGIIQLYLDA